MSLAKSAVVLLWGVLIAASVQTSSPTLSLLGRVGFLLTALAHVAEFFIYRPLLEKAPGSLARHFFQMLVFGFIYQREVRAVHSRGALR